jgi:hypothetical protein
MPAVVVAEGGFSGEDDAEGDEPAGRAEAGVLPLGDDESSDD